MTLSLHLNYTAVKVTDELERLCVSWHFAAGSEGKQNLSHARWFLCQTLHQGPGSPKYWTLPTSPLHHSVQQLHGSTNSFIRYTFTLPTTR